MHELLFDRWGVFGLKVRRLVVNADDLGYCPCRTRGIVACAPPVTACSALVGPSFQLLTRADLPSVLRVGLHVNLTEGQPVCPADEIPSLVDPATRMLRGKHGLRSSPLPLHEDVVRETRAQLRLFVERFGALPAHVDGHQHCHVVPGVAQGVAQALRLEGAEKCPVRIPRDPSGAPRRSPEEFAFLASVERDAAWAAREGLYANTVRFVGLSTQGGWATEERVLQCLRSAVDEHGDSPEELVVEWMVHPGETCRLGHGDDFNQHPDRDFEAALLLRSPSLWKGVRALGFALL